MLRFIRSLYRAALLADRWMKPKAHNLVDWEGVLKCDAEETILIKDLADVGPYSIKVDFNGGPPDLDRIGVALLMQGVIALTASGVDPIVIDTVVSRSMELGLKSTKWDRYRA